MILDVVQMASADFYEHFPEKEGAPGTAAAAQLGTPLRSAQTQPPATGAAAAPAATHINYPRVKKHKGTALPRGPAAASSAPTQ
jgi:hypothetical protein